MIGKEDWMDIKAQLGRFEAQNRVLSLSLSPLFSLVAGSGFEPETFGL